MFSRVVVCAEDIVPRSCRVTTRIQTVETMVQISCTGTGYKETVDSLEYKHTAETNKQNAEVIQCLSKWECEHDVMSVCTVVRTDEVGRLDGQRLN